jgi:anti-anti-sigma regulatory factor
MDETSYLVLRESNPVVLQIKGRAGYSNCAPARDFFQERKAAGNKEFIVDFKDCRGVDSTFLGILAGLANSLSATGGSLILTRPGEWLLTNIQHLGLDRLLKVADNSHFEKQSPVALSGSAQNEFEQARMILEAHENLIKSSPAAAPAFVDVVDFLKEHVVKKCQGNN